MYVCNFGKEIPAADLYYREVELKIHIGLLHHGRQLCAEICNFDRKNLFNCRSVFMIGKMGRSFLAPSAFSLFQGLRTRAAKLDEKAISQES